MDLNEWLLTLPKPQYNEFVEAKNRYKRWKLIVCGTSKLDNLRAKADECILNYYYSLYAQDKYDKEYRDKM